MKKILSLCTAIIVAMQSFGMLSVLAADEAPEKIYMDISGFYNASVYAEKGVAKGDEKGSSLYFPGSSSEANSPSASAGTGIEKNYFENKFSDGVLTTSGGSKFDVNTSGGVLMGSNGFTKWEIPLNSNPYSVDILSFSVNTINAELFSVQVYYEDGTVEEDQGVDIKSCSVDSGNSTFIQTIKPATGNISTFGYVNVISIELKNQYTNLKRVEKIVITQNTPYISSAYLAVTLNMKAPETDYSKSVTAELGE